MAEILRNKFVTAGGWRTLESGWNVTFSCRFRDPAGAKVKIRYGGGGWFGWDSQKKTLDGTFKMVNVSKASGFYARVQILVQENTALEYTYITS